MPSPLRNDSHPVVQTADGVFVRHQSLWHPRNTEKRIRSHNHADGMGAGLYQDTAHGLHIQDPDRIAITSAATTRMALSFLTVRP
jgi:hypothetical protein